MNTTTPQYFELDARLLPREGKHNRILSAFDALPVGESFVLVNDHDPAPLGRQFFMHRPGQVDWEYLEAGPVEWRVRIGRIAAGEATEVELKCGCGGKHHH